MLQTCVFYLLRAIHEGKASLHNGIEFLSFLGNQGMLPASEVDNVSTFFIDYDCASQGVGDEKAIDAEFLSYLEALNDKRN